MRMIPSTNIGSRVLLWDPSASALPPLGGWAVASTTARAQLPILVSWSCPSGPILRGAGNGEELAEVRPEREQSLQGCLHCWCTMCSFGNTRTQVLLCIKAGWLVPPLLVIMSRAGRADTRLYGCRWASASLHWVPLLFSSQPFAIGIVDFSFRWVLSFHRSSSEYAPKEEKEKHEEKDLRC